MCCRTCLVFFSANLIFVNKATLELYQLKHDTRKLVHMAEGEAHNSGLSNKNVLEFPLGVEDWKGRGGGGGGVTEEWL